MQMEDARKIAADWCDAWNRTDLNPLIEHDAEERAFVAIAPGNIAVPLVMEFASAPVTFGAPHRRKSANALSAVSDT
jgi:hypothetical protein